MGILEFFLVPLSAILLKFTCWNSTIRRRETDVKQTNLNPYPTTYFQPQLVVNHIRPKYSLDISWMVPSLWSVDHCSKLVKFGRSRRQGLLFVLRQGGSFQDGGNSGFPQVSGISQKAAHRWWHPSWSTMLLRVSQKAAHRWWHPSWSTMLLRVPKSLEVPSLHKHTKIVKQGSSNLFKQGSTIPLKQGSLRLQGSHSGLHILLCLSHTSWLIVIRMGRLLPIICFGQIIARYSLFVDAVACSSSPSGGLRI